MTERIRRAAVAGTWYPGDARGLAHAVDECLARAGPQSVAGRLVGLISPHAGLRYSGPVAAHAYALLNGRSGLTVLLVGPSHHMAFRGSAVWTRGAFETPLGRIPIDEPLAQALLDEPDGILDEPSPHVPEHSLEMQLPFLQHLVADLRLVPVLMGGQSRDEAARLAVALERAVQRHPALLVASSDLSHYHAAAVANRLDAQVVGDVERFSPESLMARLEARREHACGGGPMVAVMSAARRLGANAARVLRYADSGDEGEHDKSRVVGYLAAALVEA
jgi:hypothetical protein